MKLMEKISGFTVDRIRPVTDLDGKLVEMTHDKTGLKLIWLDRAEDNKTFAIAFETLPSDDTGVFHILEHSVLGGSKHYPVKEPFVELLKSSMNTFLNAMTFPDKTLYPVSSRDPQDFINLVRVYLDAVFYPSIYDKPEIFYQEGWHYEFDEEGSPSYNGVVFNEMSGAMADPDEIDNQALYRALYPDTVYSYNSGGDPTSIPNLTYEDFLNCHRKFYSPANGMIILDGTMDIEAILNIIDKEYLCNLESGSKVEENLFQNPVDGKVHEVEYELGPDEDEKGRTRISWGRVFASYDEKEKLIGAHILADILCGSNQSPLSKAVLSKGLAESVYIDVQAGIAQVALKIGAINLEDENRDMIENVIFDELKRLSEEGIDRELIDASIANFEYGARERDFGSTPQGLVYAIQILESWLYGGDPLLNLEIGSTFDDLREKAKAGYFENLIKEAILENNHKAKVVLVPSKSVGEKRSLAEAKRLQQESSKWSNDDKDRLVKIQEKLLAWQNSQDSPEALETIPRLKVEDIHPKSEALNTKERDYNNIKTLYHNENCNGITNWSMYFDADDLGEEEICLLSFLTDILGKMSTKKYDEAQLDNKVRKTFGNLSFYVSSYMDARNCENTRIKLGVTFGTLEQNVEEGLNLVLEILKETSFEGEATALDLLKQLKTKLYQEIMASGSSFGAGRIAAQVSSVGVVKECAGGYEYYRWLANEEKNWNWTSLKGRLEQLLKTILKTSRLTISLTGGNEKMLLDAAKALYDSIPNEGDRTDLSNTIKPWGKKKEGIAIPSDVSFACCGGLLEGFDGFNGHMRVATKILTYSYLWNMVRVQGGAYGTGISIREDGFTLAHSYRDPSPVKSIETYKGMAQFLNEFLDENDDIDGFIIGALSDAMPISTPRLRGMKADRLYFEGRTVVDIDRMLKEIINTTAEDIKGVATMIGKTYEDCGVCIIGNNQQLEGAELDELNSL